MSRIGVYGGSFNPPHCGHVLGALEMIRLLQLDLLYIIPAGIPPHKILPEGSPSAEERLELTRLAFAEIPNAVVSDTELRRPGPSYTVDTLEELHAKHPEDALYLIMGTDMLLSFSQWRSPERIASLAALAVMQRSDMGKKQKEALKAAIASLQLEFSARIVKADNQCLEISSTQVRCLIALDCWQGILPQPVRDRIWEKKLYRSGIDWHDLSYEELRAASLSLHDPKRVPHAIGCSESAAELAWRYGADVELAKRAGILHDVTKQFGPAAHLCVCDRYGETLSTEERSHAKLLHARTGAVVAREVFGECPEVCNAIRWHTTGHKDMTLLEKIVYLADYIEPNRTIANVDRLRQLASQDLDAAVLAGIEMTLEHLRSKGKDVDRNSMEAWVSLSKSREETL